MSKQGYSENYFDAQADIISQCDKMAEKLGYAELCLRRYIGMGYNNFSITRFLNACGLQDNRYLRDVVEKLIADKCGK